MKLIIPFCALLCVIFGSSCTISYDPYYPGVYPRCYGDYRSGFSSSYPTYRYIPNNHCHRTYHHNNPYYW